MNIQDIVKLKVAIENFLEDKTTQDDVFILSEFGYIRYIKDNDTLNILLPSKEDMIIILNNIKNKLGEQK